MSVSNSLRSLLAIVTAGICKPSVARSPVEATPGITLSALREQDEHLRVDHVYALIARNRLYVDLYTFWLKDQLHLPLYLDRPTAEAHALLRNSQRNAPFGFGDGGNLTLSANALLDWDGKRWTLLNLGKTTTTLLPEEGTLIQLETPVFLHLIDTHVIQRGEVGVL